MDFRSANAQPQPTHQSVPGSVGAPVRSSRGGDANKWLRTAAVVLLFCVTVLLLAVIGVAAFGDNNSSAESKYVNDKQYQAVFLTNGQVYFGNVKQISSDFIRLQNIYYLTQNTTTDTKGNTTTDGNYTLVKLGCQQIHDPVDEMVIERSQVSFWENLNDKGKVVTSIKQFVQQNPKGPDCSQVSNQTQATSNSNTQGSTNANSSTTNTTNKP
jgi:hypothetical protein